MSVVYLLYGAVGLLGLFLVLALTMTFAAQGAARLLGIANFQWFAAVPAAGAWWRWLVVRLVSMVVPLGVSILLYWGSLLAGGFPQFTGNRVEVRDGAALAAGMRTGDRVLRIGDQPIGDFEQLRGAVQRHSGVTAIEIERDGRRQVLEVTPRGGKIGVGPLMQVEQLSVLAAGRRAVAMPFSVLLSAGRELVRTTTGANKPELMGPVAIARETSKAQRESGSAFFSVLAVLAGYFWPFAAAVVLFDAVTGYIFRRAQPAASSSQRGYRLERLRQASLFACASYAAALFAIGLEAASLPFARLLMMWAMAAGIAGYPLIWLAGKELWGRPLAALVLVGSVFVPCLLFAAVIGVHQFLGRALKGEGFQVTWLSAQPPAPALPPARWGT
jgi:hypothetical protein